MNGVRSSTQQRNETQIENIHREWLSVLEKFLCWSWFLKFHLPIHTAVEVYVRLLFADLKKRRQFFDLLHFYRCLHGKIETPSNIAQLFLHWNMRNFNLFKVEGNAELTPNNRCTEMVKNFHETIDFSGLSKPRFITNLKAWLKVMAPLLIYVITLYFLLFCMNTVFIYQFSYLRICKSYQGLHLFSEFQLFPFATWRFYLVWVSFLE